MANSTFGVGSGTVMLPPPGVRTPVGVAELDADGRITRANDELCRLMQCEAATLLGRGFTTLIHPDDSSAVDEARRRSQDGEPASVEARLAAPGTDGLWTSTTFVCPGGVALPLLAIVVDLTERREVEARTAYQARLLAMVSEAVIGYDAAERITFWNAGAEQMYGWTAREMLGETRLRLIVRDAENEDPRSAVERAAALARGEVVKLRRAARRSDGAPLTVDVAVRAFLGSDGAISGYVSVHRDVTQQQRAETALELARTELEARIADRTMELARANAMLESEILERERAEADRNVLRLRLAAAEEQERRRISRELHDQLGQHLTGISLGLHGIGKLLPPTSPLQARLLGLQRLTDLLTRDVRYIAVQLRPPELDDVGLESAIRSYVEQWSERYGVLTEVEVGAGIEDVPEVIATTLYRVTQEALTNVARHAGAGHVSVILERKPSEYLLIIEDDGAGFGEDERRRAVSANHLGLAGMRERVTLAGGTLTIESAPGFGTTLYARLPVQR